MDDLVGRYLATRQPATVVDQVPLFGYRPGHGPAPQVIRYLTYWFARLDWSERAFVRGFLRYAPWGPVSEDYISAVLDRMAELRVEHPDGDYPAPIHSWDEGGACDDCDALRVLESMAEEPPSTAGHSP